VIRLLSHVIANDASEWCTLAALFWLLSIQTSSLLPDVLKPVPPNIVRMHFMLITRAVQAESALQ